MRRCVQYIQFRIIAQSAPDLNLVPSARGDSAKNLWQPPIILEDDGRWNSSGRCTIQRNHVRALRLLVRYVVGAVSFEGCLCTRGTRCVEALVLQAKDSALYVSRIWTKLLKNWCKSLPRLDPENRKSRAIFGPVVPTANNR
jgi:hypothetical protein